MLTEIKDDLVLVEQDTELDEENMASLEHGAIGYVLLGYLWAYIYSKDLGWAFEAQTSFRFNGKPPKRQPDIAFITKARLPKNFRMEADFAPDLAVEIVSKNDKDFDIEAKIHQYQKSGVRLVWIIHPYSQSVDVYRLALGVNLERFVGDRELDGEDVIPGFKLKVSALFERIPIIDEDDFDDFDNI